MTTTGYRVTFALLALALIAVIGGSILLIPAGDPEQLPSAVERYSPNNGDIAINPVGVMIDLKPNYAAEFIIDGTPIPPDDLNAIPETGRYEFIPGPGKTIVRWSPGSHTVVVSWLGGANNIDGGTLVWKFQTQ
jgi:hypothetical protein